MIPQLKEIINDILKEKFRNNEEFFNELTNPQISKLNDTYLSMTSISLLNSIFETAREVFIKQLELADNEFRNSFYRKNKYHVKNTRYRTVLTIIGHISYKRTEYIDKTTGKSYCYIDRKINLKQYQRIENTVIAKICTLYSDSNSMIKVGKHISELINDKDYTMSRQTVYNCLLKAEGIKVKTIPTERDVKRLYVLLDEKYISTKKEGKKMVKMACIHEGRKLVNEKSKRYENINPTYLHATEGNFSKIIDQYINEKYNTDILEEVWVLGDGATWIKSVGENIKSTDYKVIQALDKFHYKQAINRITRNEDFKKSINNYILNNDKMQFINLINSLIEAEDSEKRKEAIKKQSDYILNNMNHILNMYKRCPIGCAMEQVISHVVASSFSSVPKAYELTRLDTYIKLRNLNKSGQNVFSLVLKYLSLDKEQQKHEYCNEEYISFDNSRYVSSTYKINLPNFNSDPNFLNSIV